MCLGSASRFGSVMKIEKKTRRSGGTAPRAGVGSSKRFCGGIDIGGTKISSALFTREGKIIGKEKAPIDKAGGDKAADQVVAVIRGLGEAARGAGGRLLAVGLCVPGVVFSADGTVWAPNIAGWDRYPLRDRLIRGGERGRRAARPRRRAPGLRVPLVLESDRNAYVTGEAWRGAAAGIEDVVFLAVGTGIGAGILSRGRLIRGSEDVAGAVGWFGLDPDFKPAYAAMGCFEAEASGSSVGRKARELLASGRASAMTDLAGGRIENVTAETVAAAARSGDPLALEVVGDTVRYLAMGIANIVSLLNPRIVVLGGGLFQAADVFLEPVRREFPQWAQPLAAKAARIELSGLGEDAGLFGCGRLAWDAVGQVRRWLIRT
jgi:glucokinase